MKRDPGLRPCFSFAVPAMAGGVHASCKAELSMTVVTDFLAMTSGAKFFVELRFQLRLVAWLLTCPASCLLTCVPADD
jgi:hypothetical protein